MGINNILAKAESGRTDVQSTVNMKNKTQTNTPQQPSVLQMKIAKDKDNII